MRCYLCNKELVELKDLIDPEHQGEDHVEHIIQNSIGGRLKANGLLCKGCGGEFGDDVDTKFKELFAYFLNLLYDKGVLHIDRREKRCHVEGEYYPNPLKPAESIPVCQATSGQIFAKENTCKIFESDKKIIIYLCTKRNPGLVESMKRKIKEENPKIILEDYSLEVKDEISSEYFAWNFSKGNPEFNTVFGKGLQKIATEYAIYCGVSKTQLTAVLETDKSTNKSTMKDIVECIPYSPCSKLDYFYEICRNVLEENYPTHTLMLFDQEIEKSKRWLFCYVDLFSTFQFYVVLSKDYTGEPVSHVYSQTLAKCEEKKPFLIDEKCRPKDVDIRIQELKIDRKSLPKDLPEQIDYINKVAKEQAHLESITAAKEDEDYYDSINKSLNCIYSDLLRIKISQAPLFVKTDIIEASDIDVMEMYQSQIHVKAEDFKKCSLDVSKHCKYSVPMLCNQRYVKRCREVQEYATMKVHLLQETLK